MQILSSNKYVSPELLMVECCVEKGFGNTLEDPNVGPEIDW